MKLGIVFTGIAFGHGRDFKHCFQEISKNLILPFRSEHDVQIYLTTYTTEADAEINKMYLPKKSQFFEFKGSHQVLTYKKSMEQLLGEDLDFVIATRFDIHFHKNISNINIDYKKFNVLFKEKGHWSWLGSHKFTTDNFFAFPANQLEDLISVLDDIYVNPARPDCTDLHHVFYRMQKKIGRDNCKIISPTLELSDFNSFYSLCRQK